MAQSGFRVALGLLLLVGCQDGGRIAPVGGGGAGGGGASVPPPSYWPDAGTASPTPPPATEQCAADSVMAQRVPLDLLLVVDRSGSMNEESAGGQSKWQMATQALGAFLGDASSSGLGVALQAFPPDVACNSDADCGLPLGGLIGGVFCAERRVCNGTAVSCGGLPIPCPGGAPCVPLAFCERSRAACATPGQPCGPGDMCAGAGRTCALSAVDVCTARNFSAPTVDFAELPSGRPALEAALALSTPSGETPTAAAVNAGLAHLRARLAAQPGRQGALVLITDGLPTVCGAVGDVTTAVMAAHAAAIPTYAIGVFGTQAGPDGAAAVNTWATTGGTGRAYVLTPGMNLTQQLVDALNQIRGAALPCEYAIPTSMRGPVDFNRLNLHYQGGGADEDIAYVAKADRCDPQRGGWYYDVDPATGTPTRVVVCDATCRRFKGDPGGKVEIRLGCKTRVIE